MKPVSHQPLQGLLDRLGQLLIIGLEGPKLKKAEKKFIRDFNPSGVIYFKRNIVSHQQIARLTEVLTKQFQTRPFIAIDQEGGRVARLKDPPFTVFPGNLSLGNAYQKTKKTTFCDKQTLAMIKELKTVGVNLNFTPVLDLLTNPKNPIIGSRSFGKSPKTVSVLGARTIRLYNKAKMISCAKHFPGHGETFTDSHKVLPRVSTPFSLLKKRELKPFAAAINARVPLIMTAHVIYQKWDSKNSATLSPKILEHLRKHMHYKGVIVSDDLEMNAIALHHDLGQAAVATLNAGADLLLVCKSLSESKKVLRTVRKALQTGELSVKRIHEALTRIEKLKKTFLKRPFKMPRHFKLTFETHKKLSKQINMFA